MKSALTWLAANRLLLALYGAVTLGGFVRISYARLGEGFPLNDGGLFYQMTLDLAAAGFRLPAFTSYNGGNIPFAYPPLAFYVYGWLAQVSDQPLLTLLNWGPVVVSLLSIPVAYLVFQALLPNDDEVATAMLAYALLPGAIAWVIAGGGMTRSLGLLFLLLVMWQAHLLFTHEHLWQVITTGAALALCILSHLEYAVVAVLAVMCLCFVNGITWRGLASLVGVGVLSLALSARWWMAVVRIHGWAPFLNSGGTGESTLALFNPLFYVQQSFTGEPLLPILAVLGIIGFFVHLAERRWFMPAWAALVMLIAPRSIGATLSPAVAAFTAAAIIRLLLPGLQGMASGQRHARLISGLLAGLLLLYTLRAALSLALPVGTPLHVLSLSQRRAMAWMAENTPAESQFLVITSAASWQPDSASEWFPVLVGRPSLGTVQGQEWLPGFDQAVTDYFRLQHCAARSTTDCLSLWARRQDISFTHVYLGPQVSGALGPALSQSPQYTLIYNIDSVRIFAYDPTAE